ncbi:hypothetical protein IEQ34_005590 [Dendrobium chrysotoxum]|uniref:Ubiquitin-like protease family profile domain-containing protein n=1 Tax=Dendrobium chrysotoxum TaxID=161865 RepID=A0AAV7HAK9_DENCH|nr:hypothetical protein IEQ34_005590 [Dendrobium chrysotoxum]
MTTRVKHLFNFFKLKICMKTKKEPFQNLQTVRGIPTQSNDVDCRLFICKYMEKAIIRRKMDWASFKDWQRYMPKFRAELGYALFLTTKM